MSPMHASAHRPTHASYAVCARSRIGLHALFFLTAPFFFVEFPFLSGSLPNNVSSLLAEPILCVDDDEPCKDYYGGTVDGWSLVSTS